MSVVLLPIAAYTAVSAPVSGEAASAATLTSLALQPLANRDEYLRQPLEVSGVKKVQGLNSASMAGPKPATAAGVETVFAYNTDTESVWVYSPTSIDAALTGYVIRPSDVSAPSAGRWLNQSSLLTSRTRLKTAKRVYVPIPLTTLVPLSLGSPGPVRTTGFNGTDYGHIFYSAGSSFTSLTGVQILNDNSYANGWIFRTRLARGSLVGLSLVMSCNGTGNTPSGSLLSPTVVATPLLVRVYELAGAAGVSAAAVSDYDSNSTFPSRGPKVWEGTVGVAGNSYLEITGGTGGTGLGGGITTGDVDGLQALLLPSAPPKLFNFVSGTTTSSCKTTGGTNAPAVSNEKEYLVVVAPFTFSGPGYPTWATNGARPTIYKLEAWVDVIEPGVG